MNRQLVILSLVAVQLSAVMLAVAGVTLPSTVLWGEIRIDGTQIVTPTDSSVPAKVIARRNGVDLATYSLGDRSVLGDRFSVVIPMESLADGAGVDNTKARLGETVDLYLVQDNSGNPTETLVRSFMITQLGQVARFNLVIGFGCAGDLSPDGIVDGIDLEVFSGCLAGPGQATPPGGCSANEFGLTDLSGDMFADIADYAILQTLPGNCP